MAQDLAPEVLVLNLLILLKLHINNIISHILGKVSKISEVNLSAYVYRLFHEDLPSIHRSKYIWLFSSIGMLYMHLFWEGGWG